MAPAMADRVFSAIRCSSCSTTVRMTWRAVSRVSDGIAPESETSWLTRWTLGSNEASSSGSISSWRRLSRSSASRCMIETVEAGK